MAQTETPTEAKPQVHAPPKGAPPAATENGGHGHGHEHGHGEYPFLPHHFDTPAQQFEAGKMGIWLFLLTEVLFFAGLFCAYTIYRAMKPEVFVYAHYFLDTTMGAINTCVLLLSSLTAAWAVRNAQLGQRKLLIANIVITMACACTFMVVKYFEYSHKAHAGTLWGKHFQPVEEVWQLESFRKKHPEAAEYAAKLAKKAAEPAAATAGTAAVATGAPAAHAEPKPTREQIEPLLKAGMIGPKAQSQDGISRPKNAHVFFGIYFFMTGLHGFHVLIGIGIWVWMLLKALKNQFGPNYFGPVDYSALYWHLVDLIWIYLFPLLYLIH
jgi:cytochrome c oxidase subunit 3